MCNAKRKEIHTLSEPFACKWFDVHAFAIAVFDIISLMNVATPCVSGFGLQPDMVWKLCEGEPALCHITHLLEKLSITVRGLCLRIRDVENSCRDSACIGSDHAHACSDSFQRFQLISTAELLALHQTDSKIKDRLGDLDEKVKRVDEICEDAWRICEVDLLALQKNDSQIKDRLGDLEEKVKRVDETCRMLGEDMRSAIERRMESVNKKCLNAFRQQEKVLIERIDDWHECNRRAVGNLKSNVEATLRDIGDEFNQLQKEFSTVNEKCRGLEQTYKDWFKFGKVLDGAHPGFQADLLSSNNESVAQGTTGCDQRSKKRSKKRVH